MIRLLEGGLYLSFIAMLWALALGVALNPSIIWAVAALTLLAVVLRGMGRGSKP